MRNDSLLVVQARARMLSSGTLASMDKWLGKEFSVLQRK
jgi:hypothetical protein